jgi:hypothetical protein
MAGDGHRYPGTNDHAGDSQHAPLHVGNGTTGISGSELYVRMQNLALLPAAADNAAHGADDAQRRIVANAQRMSNGHNELPYLDFAGVRHHYGSQSLSGNPNGRQVIQTISRNDNSPEPPLVPQLNHSIPPGDYVIAGDYESIGAPYDARSMAGTAIDDGDTPSQPIYKRRCLGGKELKRA